MKKYSSYFNKRYFPEQEENEEPLSDASLSEETESAPESDVAPTPMSTPVQSPEPAVTTSAPSHKASSFSFPSFDMPEEEEPLQGSPSFSPPESEHVKISPVFNIPEEPVPPSDVETTIISESAVINGEMSVTGNIKMYGKIKGNLTATGNLEIQGKVIGNLSGNDVELAHCELKGDVNAIGFTFMDQESIMIGNLNSHDVTLDGKVKGDVSAVHKVYVRANAVIVGNVRAAVIAIDEGAALQGQVIISSKENDSLSIAQEENQ